MKKYIIHFLEISSAWIFGIATALFVLFFSVLLLNHNALYSPACALWVYAVAALCWILNTSSVFTFRKMVHQQAQLLNITLFDTNTVPLYKGSLIFLSDDWLIIAGRFAFCKQYIKHISIIPKKINIGNDYWIKVQTSDAKAYSFHVDSYTNAKKIVAWISDSTSEC